VEIDFYGMFFKSAPASSSTITNLPPPQQQHIPPSIQQQQQSRGSFSKTMMRTLSFILSMALLATPINAGSDPRECEGKVM